MPDISLLVELAEFYQVSISEIIDGERKREEMTQETKDTAVKMAMYSKMKFTRKKGNNKCGADGVWSSNPDIRLCCISQ